MACRVVSSAVLNSCRSFVLMSSPAWQWLNAERGLAWWCDCCVSIVNLLQLQVWMNKQQDFPANEDAPSWHRSSFVFKSTFWNYWFPTKTNELLISVQKHEVTLVSQFFCEESYQIIRAKPKVLCLWLGSFKVAAEIISVSWRCLMASEQSSYSCHSCASHLDDCCCGW